MCRYNYDKLDAHFTSIFPFVGKPLHQQIQCLSEQLQSGLEFIVGSLVIQFEEKLSNIIIRQKKLILILNLHNLTVYSYHIFELDNGVMTTPKRHSFLASIWSCLCCKFGYF